MKCRWCGEPVRRVVDGDGLDPDEYEWTHESGGLFCDNGYLDAAGEWHDPSWAEPETS